MSVCIIPLLVQKNYGKELKIQSTKTCKKNTQINANTRFVKQKNQQDAKNMYIHYYSSMSRLEYSWHIHLWLSLSLTVT